MAYDYEMGLLEELGRLERTGFLPPVPDEGDTHDINSGLKHTIEAHLRNFAVYIILPARLKKDVVALYETAANVMLTDPLKTADCEELDGRLQYLSDKASLIAGVIKSHGGKAVTPPIRQYLEDGAVDAILYPILNPSTANPKS